MYETDTRIGSRLVLAQGHVLFLAWPRPRLAWTRHVVTSLGFMLPIFCRRYVGEQCTNPPLEALVLKKTTTEDPAPPDS